MPGPRVNETASASPEQVKESNRLLLQECKLRLQYAALKAQRGWTGQRFDEVENLYHQRARAQALSRSPTSSADRDTPDALIERLASSSRLPDVPPFAMPPQPVPHLPPPVHEDSLSPLPGPSGQRYSSEATAEADAVRALSFRAQPQNAFLDPALDPYALPSMLPRSRNSTYGSPSSPAMRSPTSGSFGQPMRQPPGKGKSVSYEPFWDTMAGGPPPMGALPQLPITSLPSPSHYPTSSSGWPPQIQQNNYSNGHHHHEQPLPLPLHPDDARQFYDAHPKVPHFQLHTSMPHQQHHHPQMQDHHPHHHQQQQLHHHMSMQDFTPVSMGDLDQAFGS